MGTVNVQSYIGKKYGRYTVLSFSHSDANYQKFMNVMCDCGNVRTVCLGVLRYGSSRSCGCLKNEVFIKMVKKVFTKHGKSKMREYAIWKSIKRRCLKINSREYPNYGGRGISICKRWVNSYPNFINDMGPRPSKKHSIERIKNNKGYSPSNCKWATTKEQCANRRSNIVLNYNGKKLILSEFSKIMNVSSSSISVYIKIHGAREAVIYYSKKHQNAA